MKDTATRASFSVIDRVRGLAEPLARFMGMDIWGIEFQPAGRSMLRIYLEGPGGVGIDECAEFSRLVGLSLEVEDVIPSAYTLEVSSPGLERTFFEEAQLAPYAGTGDLLELQLLEAPAARPGRRKFTGLLVSVKDGSFSFQPVDGEGMAPQGEPFDITWPDIKKIRCLYYAPPSRKPDGRKTAAKKTPPAPATEQAPTPVLEDSHELGT